MDVEVCPSQDTIEELKNLLSDLQKKGWKVKASENFQKLLKSIATKNGRMTKQGATGSPCKAQIAFQV